MRTRWEAPINRKKELNNEGLWAGKKTGLEVNPNLELPQDFVIYRLYMYAPSHSSYCSTFTSPMIKIFTATKMEQAYNYVWTTHLINPCLMLIVELTPLVRRLF